MHIIFTGRNMCNTFCDTHLTPCSAVYRVTFQISVCEESKHTLTLSLKCLKGKSLTPSNMARFQPPLYLLL